MAKTVKRSLRATYRVQLTPAFGFTELRRALPFLDQLGISHLYLSPVFRSRQGSTHGYDVTSHAELNPELGGEAAFQDLVEQCQARDIGIVLDVVPNHMAVMTTDNPWWLDVLENGPASPFADYFDIDWTPARAAMRHRLLVPVLGAPLGEEIDRGAIRLRFNPAAGEFSVCYESMQFPVDPVSYGTVLRLLREGTMSASVGSTVLSELAALEEGFAALPPAIPSTPEVRLARADRARLLKRHLSKVFELLPELAEQVDAVLEEFAPPTGGGDAERLAAFLARQPYRLAFWRVSGEEINYRRFFDVNELAALRMEDDRVFDATHALVRRLWREGAIDGVRVDHADGLYDPAQYFPRLRGLLGDEGASREPWLVVEKILGPAEKLPANWRVDGTTGYEFAALVTSWLMNPEGAAALEKTHTRFVRNRMPYAEIAYHTRRLVMRSVLASEISALAARLDRLAQRHRDTADFTLFDLREAIVETLAHFPVYRTYIRDHEVAPEDIQHIRRAIGAARGRKQAGMRELDFLERVLLGLWRPASDLHVEALEFTLKFQQVAAPVMAKGIEDTAYYRHASLLAMNEVGGDPLCWGIDSAALHRANQARLRESPRSMLASSTHDTKRGEDARHRLAVLTELPEQWAKAVGHWRRLKARGRSLDVDAEQQYLLLQALLAIWPLDVAHADRAALRERLQEYSIKSAREAKVRTSWLEPDAAYEAELRRFVGLLLPPAEGPGFAQYFQPILERAAYFGVLNALSALVLKLTSPGIPDIYQGNELPSLVLVDPDNRRPVDFGNHQQVLDALIGACESKGTAQVAAELLRDWRSGSLKLFLTWRLLLLRRNQPQLFEAGEYVSLDVEGTHAPHLAAYLRQHEGQSLLVVVSRWASTLSPDALAAPLGSGWQDTRIHLPPGFPAGEYEDTLTGNRLQVGGVAAGTVLVGDLLTILPVTVLTRTAPCT